MKRALSIAMVLLLTVVCGCSEEQRADSDGWVSLFNGKDLSGWKSNETPGCFSVEDGVLKVKGGRSHLFYAGDVANANFKNFHFSAKIKTTPGSNSGIYFHTRFQDKGWLNKGYECQINITQSDKKKSGGLYGIQDTFEQHAKDNQWYTQEILVLDKNIVLILDGKIIANYIEGDPIPGWEKRRLSSGTFALQAHDPTCLVYFKDIKVKPLK